MKPTRIASTVLVALFVASSPRVALADPPPAQFTIQLDGDAAIWNPFEDFEACETVTDLGVTATLCVTLLDVLCDGAGRCTGDARLEFSDDIDGVLTGPGTAKATCKATPDDPLDDVCKAKLGFDASGPISVSIPGQTVLCDAEISNFVVKGPVDSAGFFQGKGKAKLCLDCDNGARACGGVGGAFEYQVNPPIPWQLTVDLDSDPVYPNNLSGTATDSLGPFEYTATGRYNPTTDESTLSLKGVTKKVDPASISQGAKIKLGELDCAAAQCSGTATFKVQGNSVKDAPVAP